MGITCNIPSPINMSNDSPPASLVFDKCSKNSPVIDILRENNFLCWFKHFKNSVKYVYIKI